MRQIIDTEDPEEASILGSEGQTPTNSAESNAAELLFPPDNFSLSLSNLDLQPDPAHIFSLWQIFLDRVNPITKLIHVPSLQPYVVEATTNPANVPLKYRALLFSIYLMATISLSDQECTQLLGIPREQALQQFSSGTTKALIKCDYLRNYDMAILQCLSLFLVSSNTVFFSGPQTNRLKYSLQGRSDRHAAWIFSGTVTRIARKMGYHRDGEFLNLTPFETEMRRRIWWQVLTQDAKLALVSGLNHKFFNDIHDTKQPLNLNDADLFPGSTEPVQSREGPTEMAFVLICCRLATFLVTESSIKGYETAILGEEDMDQADTHHDIKEKYRVIIRELEQDLLDIEQRYCDPSAGNAHIAALSMRQALIQKFHDMLVPMREQPEWGTELFCAKDNLFKLCLLNIESSIDLHERMANLGFAWAMKQDFQFDLFAVLTGQLYKRPTGTLPDRGWIAIEKIHDYQPQLFDVAQKHYAAQAAFTLKAWKARERGLSFSGLKVEVPAFITKLRESLGHDSVRTPAMTPPKTTQMQQTNGLDEFLGGYLDVSSLDWDMWGDVGGNGMGGNQQPISASLFGGFVNMGNMGGM